MNGIASAGLGIMLSGWNDARQIDQQRKLGDLQLGFDKQMTDYQRESQMKMWNDTNYSAQMGQMEKAGLNAGLIYGMSGGGATTVGGGAANSKGAAAPMGGNEQLGIMQTLASVDLTKAQTEKVKAETPTNGENIGNANVANTKANTDLTKTNNEIAKLTKELNKETLEENIKIVLWKLEQEQANYIKLSRENQIGNETQEAEITKRKAESIGALINNEAVRVGIKLDKAKINQIVNEIEQGWSKIDINNRNATTAEGKLI